MIEKELVKNDIVQFLFWLQYDEQKELLEKWLHTQASNSYVAQQYLDDCSDQYWRSNMAGEDD